ncbi:MAG: replication-associated recombination protein A [Candidatus Omnitrophica bacterium]|nr:replication-associated recombination protein A [Candidatus Omnitrophota bacterium]
MKEDLFEDEIRRHDEKDYPLAVRMRPRTLDEIVGQSHILGEGKLLTRVVRADKITSLIFYGPPGSGKTTLASVISLMTHSAFVSLNAVTSNVSEIRKVLDAARKRKEREGKRTILFIDEIHRFNKAQQDVLMPDVETGAVILIGSTVHNPSFAIIGPLISRSTIFELRPLAEGELVTVLERALKDKERGFGNIPITVDKQVLPFIAKSGCGDARRVLNALEVGVLSTQPATDGKIHLTLEIAQESVQKKAVYYDKDEDYHYDTASAFIKSMRGSDPDAAVYWLAKMIEAGEDLRFIVRRILILASEDIGNADPQALVLASAGAQAVEYVGLPEARIILSQLVTYMALAPKSNAAYLAIDEAMSDIEKNVVEEVPNQLRDKNYFGAKRLGHGEGYKYVHSHPDHYIKQEYIKIDKRYYRPTEFGYEKVMKQRLDELKH